MRILLAAAALLLFPAAAHAAPPANDARTAPQAVSLPASVTGTTLDSTLEADEPPSCSGLRGSVWYSLTAADATRIVVRLAAAGDLDGVVDVFKRTRSQLSFVACEPTDDQGAAEATFRPEKGASYLIRVGQRANSVPGTFRLDVFAPQPAPTAPGPALPSNGAGRTLDRVQDTSDAYSMTMRAGTSYRINLSEPGEGCVSVALYPPGTRGAFEDATPVKRVRCGGYLLFTPAAGQGGRYSFLVTAQSGRRGPQPYHLQAAVAGPDDTAPGLPLSNYQKVRGALQGATIDVVDLYRFEVARRSDLKVTLKGHTFDLQLLGETGRRLATGDAGELQQRLSPGRYFIAVRTNGEKGSYVLERVARAITRTSVSLPSRAAPGQSVHVAVKVTPGAAGPVQITLQRFDPLAGWQFFRQVAVRSGGNGTAGYGFVPPAVGRWRATAAFLGTRTDAPSAAGFSTVLVAPPLAGT